MLKEIGDANLKSRLGNKSAFLCAVLIYSANKNDQYLTKMTHCCVLSTHSLLKLSPISADKKGTVFIRS